MDAKHLVVFFRNRLALALLGNDPGETIDIGGVKYTSKFGANVTAFWDAIRATNGELIGFQITPTVGEKYFPKVLGDLRYVRLSNDAKQLLLFLKPNPPRQWSVDPDQAFGGFVYESVTGELAIGITLEEWLTPADMASLTQANVDWIQVAA